MPPRDAAGFLRASPVFAALPAKELEALAAAARDESHRAREYVFMEGDPSHWLYIVKSGRVKILKRSRTGKDVVLELLGPGELFGGVAVIMKGGTPWQPGPPIPPSIPRPAWPCRPRRKGSAMWRS